MPINEITPHGEQHAIEAANFAIVFRSNVDEADEGRFEDGKQKLQDLFGSIDSPGFFQIQFGEDERNNRPPVLKKLADFGRDGKREWSAQFGENAVALTCLRYTNWDEIWPNVEERLDALIEFIDQFKLVGSIEHSVTDTFYAAKDNKAILSKGVFKGGDWIPNFLLEYDDPRWDFSCGKFIKRDDRSETLERMEAKSIISGNQISVSITNSFSHRYFAPVRLKELLRDSKLNADTKGLFEGFHENNKTSIRSILNDELLTRIGL